MGTDIISTRQTTTAMYLYLEFYSDIWNKPAASFRKDNNNNNKNNNDNNNDKTTRTFILSVTALQIYITEKPLNVVRKKGCVGLGVVRIHSCS